MLFTTLSHRLRSFSDNLKILTVFKDLTEYVCEYIFSHMARLSSNAVPDMNPDPK